MAKGVWGRGRSWFWDLMFGDQEGQNAYFDESSPYTIGEAPTSGSTPSVSGGGGGAKRDPKMSIIKKVGLALISGGGSAGRDFEPAEYNFEEITDAYNTEGYVRQAVDKYIEMMFKAGWDFVGKNPNAVEYVRMRFKLMAEATQIPTNQLFLELAEDLVKYSNVVVAKARAKDALPFQGMNVMGVGENMPVAGYFPLSVASMTVRRDKFGVIKGWQQEVEGQDKAVKFKPDDIVHIYYKREKGKAFGTPFMLPALDDIRALRQIEENVLRLVHRNLHPLWHIKVGIAQEGLGAEDGEVDAVRAEIENMDLESGFITSERVEIKPVASNQIIDAEKYLKHFEQRTFSVMGVSELMMGRGNSANRSTGDNISGEFVDRCKAFQRIMATFIDEFMIKEILMEGGFDPVLNPDDAVSYTFKEIDMDSQIKAENQAVFLYEHNAITEDEMRELISRDPIDDGEMRSKMHLQVVTIATLEAEAALAPAPAATATGSSGGSTAKPKSTKATDNKTKPANQHGVKSSPKKTTNAIQLRYTKEMFSEYTLLNDAVKALVNRHYKEHGVSHVNTIHGAFAYSEQKMLSVTMEHLGEDVAKAMAIPVKRMMSSVKEKILKSLKEMEGVEQTREITQAVFDVYTDRLQDVAAKAFGVYESQEEVENDGQEQEDNQNS